MPRKKQIANEEVLTEELLPETDLPEGWKWVKLGQIGQIISGGTPSTSNALYWNDDVNWISPSDLTNYRNIYIKKGAKSISQLGLLKSSARLLPTGSILFSSRAPIGYVAIAEEVLATNQGFKSIVPNDNINSKYVYFYLKSIVNYANSIATGTTFKELSATAFKQISFPLPPLPTQQKIVAKIEQLFVELDAGVETLKAAQQQLKVYRQAVLKAAFEGRLTNEKVDGELPSGWKIIRLEELMESVKNGYSRKPLSSGEYRILRISSVRPNVIDLADTRYLNENIGDENLISENDILFTRYNGSIDFVGICARVPSLYERYFYPDKLIRCRPKLKLEYHSKYISYVSNQGASRQYVIDKLKTTAGQKGIAGTEIKSIPIPLAPLEEQQSIVTAIETRLTACEAMEKEIEVQLNNAAQLRQSILKKAFSGQLIS